MLVTNLTAQDYYFGPLHLAGGNGQSLTVDDTTATSLYLTDDGVADAINTLAAANMISVSGAAAPFPRPTGTPEVLHGDGSPEGLIYAGQGSVYMARTAGSATNFLFAKTSGIHVNTGWVPINPGGVATYRKNTAKAVNTTTSATDLLNGEINIAAGAMGPSAFLRLSAWGDWLNNSGGAVAPPRFQLALAATTVIDTNVAGTGYNSDATRREWKLEANVVALNSASAQETFLRAAITQGTQFVGGSTAHFTTGHGEYVAINGANLSTADGGNQTAVDLSGLFALKLNVINGSASANYETRLLGALVEII